MATSKGRKNHIKGAEAEELLASYFRANGYFTVRGVCFNYRSFSVTDVDLWLYTKSSGVSREISIVDVKNKRTPQAMERIFWVKGLQSALKADKALVATTDTREEVRTFGKRLDVTVLDGKFLKRLQYDVSIPDKERLTEEEFHSAVKTNTLGTIDGDWVGRVESGKRQLADGLNFDSINLILDHGQYFAEQVVSRPTMRELASRCFYRSLSFLAINIDSSLSDVVSFDDSEIENMLRVGFTYGQRGRSNTLRAVDQGLALVEQFGGRNSINSTLIRSAVIEQFENIPAEDLAKVISAKQIRSALVDIAIELDHMAMATTFRPHQEGSLPLRSFVGGLLDFWSIDRRAFVSDQ